MNANAPTTPQTSSTSTQPPVAPKNPPPFQITPISKGNRYLKILFYGKQGAGKSTLAGSAVDVEMMQDVLFIDIESGDLAITDNDRILHPELIDRVPVNNFKQVAKIHEFLTAHVKLRDENNIERLKFYEAWLKGTTPDQIETPRKYRTVIIDSLTELEAYCMYGLLGIQGEFDMAKIDDDMKTAEFAEYKKNNNMVNLLVRAFRDLPMNIIIVCAQAYEKDELQRFHYFPSLTGKLRTQIQGYFDIVGYLATSDNAAAGEKNAQAARRLYVQPTGKFDAKNRRASFKESFIDDPTFLSIMKAVGLMQKDKS